MPIFRDVVQELHIVTLTSNIISQLQKAEKLSLE